MSSIINSSDVTKKNNKNNNIGNVNRIKEQLMTNDYEFLEIFYNYVEMQDLESAKEIRFQSLKSVVADLSIKFSYDFEGVIDIINSRHSHLLGISYPLFKENLLEWLENQQKVLSNTVMMNDDRNKIGPGNMSTISKLKNSFNNISNNNENNNKNLGNKDFDFGEDIDINMIILHRSLYLLKRKFEDNDIEIRKTYSKYATREKIGLEVETSNFYNVIESVMKEAGFSFTEINRASELFKIEVLEKLNQDKVVLILKELKKYMEIHRERYNELMKERKGFKEVGVDYIEEVKIEEKEEVNNINDKVENNENNTIPDELENDITSINKKKRLESAVSKVTSNEKKSSNSKDKSKEIKTNASKPTVKASSKKATDQDSKLDKTNKDKESKTTKKIESSKKTTSIKEKESKENKDKKTSSKIVDKKKTDNTASKETSKEKDKSIDKDKTKKVSSKNETKNTFVSKTKTDKDKKTTSKSPSQKSVDDKKSKLKSSDISEAEIKNENNENKFLDTNNENIITNVEENSNNDIDGEKYNKPEKIREKEFNDLPKEPILFIEVLPLLIADFIQENPGIVVVNKTTSLKAEIKTLFDNEIMHRLGEKVNEDNNEENVNRIKELLFEKMNVENNMQVYEDLMLKNRAIGKNTVFIEGMLQKLKMQKIFLDKNIKDLQDLQAETENKYQDHVNSLNQMTEKVMDENQIAHAFEFVDEQKVRSSKPHYQPCK